MSSEYDTPFNVPRRVDPAADLETVREHFEAAGRPYLSSPWPWLGWATIFPFAALVTRPVAQAFASIGVVLLWSIAILIGGAVEILSLPFHLRGRRSTALASWVFMAQGNLSVVAVVLSLLLLSVDQAWALPALWLLTLGHSLFVLGSLSYRPLKRAGIIYQVGGVVALLPVTDPLVALAVATFAANGWVGLSLIGARRTA